MDITEIEDLAWRLKDIRDNLLSKDFGGQSIFGMDEWSTNIKNLDIVINKLEFHLGK